MTNQVVLRDVIEGDLLILFEQQQDEEANRMAAFPARDRDSFIAHWTKILGDVTVTKKTILFDGCVAGNILSFEQSGRPLVGYWIGRDYWNKGIATRALSRFLDHIEVRPVFAHVAKHNIGSIRVLQKCGFVISGEGRVFSDPHGEEVEEFILQLGATEGDRQVVLDHCSPNSP